MTIAIYALKEKIRRKELYIIAALGILVVLLFSTGVGTLSIGGEPVTGFRNLAPLMLGVIHVLGGALAIALSIGTIPNEYERKTSHLIWIRGIHQVRYHGELAFANVISSLLGTFIMECGLLFLACVKGETGELFRILLACAILSISIAVLSVIASACSIVFPKMVAGVIASLFYIVGMLHGILDTVRGITGGVTNILLKVLLSITPDLNGLMTQAAHVLKGEAVSAHGILMGLLALYIGTLVIVFYQYKEA